MQFIRGHGIQQEVARAHQSPSLVDSADSAKDRRVAAFALDLLEIISSNGGEADIASSFCQLIAKVVPCDLVVIERRESPGAPPATIGTWPRPAEGGNEAGMDCNAVRRAYERRRPCIAYPSSGSVSAMAAPLFEGGHMTGVLSVRSEGPEFRYDGHELRILEAVASGAAFKLHSLDLDVDVRHAATIQRRMLPKSCMTVEGFEIEGYLQSCREVGGDLYQCFPMLGGNHLLALGDVAGKGFSAAICMSAASSLLALLAETTSELGELVSRAHQHLFQSYGPVEFLTLFAAELAPGSGRVRYVSAGHEPARWVHGDGSIGYVCSNGLPLALVEVEDFEVAEIQLEEGDLLAIFSDGLSEATRDWEEFLGDDAIDEILRSYRHEPLPLIRGRIMDAVLDFVGPDGITDDTTLMLLRRTNEPKVGKNPQEGRRP